MSDEDKNPGADMGAVKAMTPDPLADALRRIQSGVDQISWHATMTRGQLDTAECAGSDLAATVQRFLADPAAVGTDALYQAYGRYMAQHAGNFSGGRP